jgi:hypothetical protein
LIKAKKTFIKSNYAISTKEPTLLICKGSKISTEDGKTLETEQLYFDQKKRMVLQKENLNYQIQRELQWARNRF